MESHARVIEVSASGLELAPETVLPSQFFDRLQVDASLQPEKRLMLAVLEDAVGTFQKYVNVGTRHGRRLFSEAEEWFASTDADWPFAFVNVCQALSLDAEYLRAGLWRWRDRQPVPGAHTTKVVRFPFRRVNGSRHSVTGRPVGLKRSA